MLLMFRNQFQKMTMDGFVGKTLAPKKGAKIQFKPTRTSPHDESNFLSHKTLEKADDMYYYSFCQLHKLVVVGDSNQGQGFDCSYSAYTLLNVGSCKINFGWLVGVWMAADVGEIKVYPLVHQKVVKDRKRLPQSQRQ